jgi:hypothetical protein
MHLRCTLLAKTACHVLMMLLQLSRMISALGDMLRVKKGVNNGCVRTFPCSDVVLRTRAILDTMPASSLKVWQGSALMCKEEVGM